MYILLALAGLVCLYEAAHSYNHRASKQVTDLHEDARLHRLRQLSQLGDEDFG